VEGAEDTGAVECIGRGCFGQRRGVAVYRFETVGIMFFDV
jgi:hypothetical protein